VGYPDHNTKPKKIPEKFPGPEKNQENENEIEPGSNARFFHSIKTFQNIPKPK